MVINALNYEYTELNQVLRDSNGDCTITNCCGQRFIGAGISGRSITVSGIPGNALGAYLNGAQITVHANAQDAVGDTMNDGTIIIHGNIGDAAGYAMRGGHIFVKGNAGYRAGIHMKAYREKVPVMVIGGTAGSFLGEYQAGGIIIVLGLGTDGKKIVGNFPCTGMHGGTMYLRGDCSRVRFPGQVTTKTAAGDTLVAIRDYLSEFCELFGYPLDEILQETFTVVTPDSSNPYRQMYVAN
ncbi:MAG: glutamate synthase [Lachnospiraceae bacterium]|nr:glutamate synthase [Lachnospiraceae bacterium]